MSTDSHITEEQIKAIYRGEETRLDVLTQLFSDVKEDFKIRAFWRYCFQRPRNGRVLNSEEVDELLHYYRMPVPEFSGIARNAIGEPAIFDLLSRDQYEYLLGEVKSSS